MIITYRSIKQSDIDDIKNLCEECFPVRYPERWYKSLTSSSKYFTLAALDSEKLVGLIVAKIKNQNQCNPEDINILNQGFFHENKLVYILTLGITNSYRKQGIASELLTRLLSFVNSKLSRSIKAVYLHVLTTNSNAIYFYEKRGFTYAQMLPDYYSIDEKLFPAFTYILYLNGGCPPKGFRDYVLQITGYFKFLVCIIARFFFKIFRQPFGMFNFSHKQSKCNKESSSSNSNSRLLDLNEENKFNENNCLTLNSAFKSGIFSKTGYDSSPLRL